MTLVKHRPNIWVRQSADEVDFFGPYAHFQEQKGIVRSTSQQLLPQLAKAKKSSKDLDSSSGLLPAPEEYLTSTTKGGKDDLQSQVSKGKKFAKGLQKIDQARYMEYYQKRSETPEIRMQEEGRHPYSFYLINKVKFVGDQTEGSQADGAMGSQSLDKHRYGSLSSADQVRQEYQTVDVTQGVSGLGSLKKEPQRGSGRRGSAREIIRRLKKQPIPLRLGLITDHMVTQSATKIDPTSNKKIPIAKEPATQSKAKESSPELPKTIKRYTEQKGWNLADQKRSKHARSCQNLYESTHSNKYGLKNAKGSKVGSSTRFIEDEEAERKSQLPLSLTHTMNALLKETAKMHREDFLSQRKARKEKYTKKGVDLTKEIVFDIESKNFIARDEIQDDSVAKQHINQPIIRKVAKVARAVNVDDANNFNSRRQGLHAGAKRQKNHQSYEHVYTTLGCQDQTCESPSPKNETPNLLSTQERLQDALQRAEDRTNQFLKVPHRSSPSKSKKVQGPKSMGVNETGEVGGLEKIHEVSFEGKNHMMVDKLDKSSLISEKLPRATKIPGPALGKKASVDLKQPSHLKGNGMCMLHMGQVSGSSGSPTHSQSSGSPKSPGDPSESLKLALNFAVVSDEQETLFQANQSASDAEVPSQTLWRFRLTDSDFFEQYQEQQRRLREEIARQQSAMNVVRPKPYEPVIKKTPQEELDRTYRVKKKTKQLNQNLLLNSQRYIQLKSKRVLAKQTSAVQLKSRQGADLQPRAVTKATKKTKVGGPQSKKSYEMTLLGSNELPGSDFNIAGLLTAHHQAINAAENGFDFDQEVPYGGGQARFGTGNPNATTVTPQSRMAVVQTDMRQPVTSRSFIPEADTIDALVKKQEAKRPITRDQDGLGSGAKLKESQVPLIQEDSGRKFSPKKGQQQQDELTFINIKVDERGSIAADSSSFHQTAGSQHLTHRSNLKQSQGDGTQSQPRLFKQLTRKVSFIANDYVKKQREIIEKRTQQSFSSLSKKGSIELDQGSNQLPDGSTPQLGIPDFNLAANEKQKIALSAAQGREEKNKDLSGANPNSSEASSSQSQDSLQTSESLKDIDTSVYSQPYGAYLLSQRSTGPNFASLRETFGNQNQGEPQSVSAIGNGLQPPTRPQLSTFKTTTAGASAAMQLQMLQKSTTLEGGDTSSPSFSVPRRSTFLNRHTLHHKSDMRLPIVSSANSPIESLEGGSLRKSLGRAESQPVDLPIIEFIDASIHGSNRKFYEQPKVTPGFLQTQSVSKQGGKQEEMKSTMSTQKRFGASLATKELKQRENFVIENRKFNSMQQANPQLTLPSIDMEILDMIPRADINEDQTYRRAIPKSVRMFKFRQQFSEHFDKLPSLTMFCNALTKAALATTKDREEKYHGEEIREANAAVENSMRETLNETKMSTFVKTKGAIESKALNEVKQKTRRLFNKPIISDMLTSRSTQVNKSSITRQTRERLFGGTSIEYPEGTPMIQLLDYLDERQLYKLNTKICSLYQKDLKARSFSQNHRTIIDIDPKIRKRRPTVQKGSKPSHVGPPLKRKAGHFIFKDKFKMPAKQSLMMSQQSLFAFQFAGAGGASMGGSGLPGTRGSMDLATIVDSASMSGEDQSQYPDASAPRTGEASKERQAYHLKPPSRQVSPSALGGSARRLDTSSVSPGNSAYGGGFAAGCANSSVVSELGTVVEGGPGQATKRRVKQSIAQIRGLNDKFAHLEQYQELVSDAVHEAIGRDMFRHRSFYASADAKDETYTESVSGRGSPSSPLPNRYSSVEQDHLLRSETSLSQQQLKPGAKNQTESSLARRQKMIRRSDAIRTLNLLAQSKANLPETLRENKMKADDLLFKEAQIGYQQRRLALQKQIVIDNIHYCTIKQIAERAEENPKEKKKKLRNDDIKARARELIKQEEKRKYKGSYREILEQRRLEEERQEKAKLAQMHNLIMDIDVGDKIQDIHLKKDLKKVYDKFADQKK